MSFGAEKSEKTGFHFFKRSPITKTIWTIPLPNWSDLTSAFLHSTFLTRPIHLWNLHIQGFLMLLLKRVQGWHLFQLTPWRPTLSNKGMLPKRMGYQVGNEVSEPEGGIYQLFKKMEKKERKRNQPTIWRGIPKSVSINLKYAWEWTHFKRKSPWSDCFDRRESLAFFCGG